MDMFYLPDDQDRTLRISMMHVSPPKESIPNPAREALEISVINKNATIEELNNKRYLCSYQKDTWEFFRRLTFQYWFVSWLRPNDQVTLAHINYCMLRKQKKDPETVQFIELLDKSIRNGNYLD